MTAHDGCKLPCTSGDALFELMFTYLTIEISIRSCEVPVNSRPLDSSCLSCRIKDLCLLDHI